VKQKIQIKITTPFIKGVACSACGGIEQIHESINSLPAEKYWPQLPLSTWRGK
jgi:hypothetical protein